jgi:glucan 1,3-beta-glucosidase
MSHLASKKINAFSGIGHGFYFWNFRTDLNNPQWYVLL